MSLIPYHGRDGREIVLRHHNAIVVRDPLSRELQIAVECPTCHQPLRPASPEIHFDSSPHDTYVDPDYFRMLRDRNGHRYGQVDRPPSSPIRRLVQPFLGVNDDVPRNAEFVSSAPSVQEGSRIRRESFSPNYFNSFFVEERELGRGGKGVVLLVRHEIDGCQLGHFACKRVPVGNDHAWLEKVLVEVELLAKLSHPNLVSYRHVWLEDVQLTNFGPSVACAFILQQYCNSGDLHQYVLGDLPKEPTKEELKAQMRRRSKGQAEMPQGLFASQRRLPFEEIYSLFKDITSGLAYLHAANYIHRDLKPSNCLLHREGKHLVCLISDFGEVQPENAVRKSTGSTGTISYCAPEVLRRDATGRYENFTTKSDIFSLGMILYFMCFGRLPYKSANTVQEELEDVDELRAEITHWKGFQDERRERPDLPAKLYQLLKKLLALSPTERPSASEVLSAMKTDGSLDALARGGGGMSASPPHLGGLGGRRIQSLDSPAAVPGTPVRDPAKHAKVASSSDEDLTTIHHESPRPTFRNNFSSSHSLTASTSNTTRHRNNHSHSMTLSRSSEGYTRALSRSPERPTHNHNTTSNLTLNRTHNHDHDHDQAITPDLDPSDNGSELDHPLTSPPLLMAPPTTLLADLRHRATLLLHRASHQSSEQHLTSVAKLTLFLVKMATLLQVCWPYSVGRLVGAGLFALAAGEMVIPGLDSERGSFEEQNDRPTRWQTYVEEQDEGDNTTGENLAGNDTAEQGAGMAAAAAAAAPRANSGRHHHQAIRRGRGALGRGWNWNWNWRASVVLSALHFLILGTASRFGMLCAVPDGERRLR